MIEIVSELDTLNLYNLELMMSLPQKIQPQLVYEDTKL